MKLKSCSVFNLWGHSAAQAVLHLISGTPLMNTTPNHVMCRLGLLPDLPIFQFSLENGSSSTRSPVHPSPCRAQESPGCQLRPAFLFTQEFPRRLWRPQLVGHFIEEIIPLWSSHLHSPLYFRIVQQNMSAIFMI